MSAAIVDVLTTCGHIDRDLLAKRFAHRWADDPSRGYGGGAHSLLHALCLGKPWRSEAAALFGTGSFGNGGAMRAAPVGAYFAFDPDATIVEQARASAEVTHAHTRAIHPLERDPASFELRGGDVDDRRGAG